MCLLDYIVIALAITLALLIWFGGSPLDNVL